MREAVHLSIHMRGKSEEVVNKKLGQKSPTGAAEPGGAMLELLGNGDWGSSQGVFFEVGSLAGLPQILADITQRNPSFNKNPPPAFFSLSHSSCTALRTLISQNFIQSIPVVRQRNHMHRCSDRQDLLLLPITLTIFLLVTALPFHYYFVRQVQHFYSSIFGRK